MKAKIKNIAATAHYASMVTDSEHIAATTHYASMVTDSENCSNNPCESNGGRWCHIKISQQNNTYASKC
jgi:hypothetical protein